jgi:hypothetical protein
MSEREWFDTEQGKSIGFFADEFMGDEHIRALLCPKCGRAVNYWEEAMGDSRWGQPEGIWWFACDHCGIQTGEKDL